VKKKRHKLDKGKEKPKKKKENYVHWRSRRLDRLKNRNKLHNLDGRKCIRIKSKSLMSKKLKGFKEHSVKITL